MQGDKNQVSRRRFLKNAAVATPAIAAANVLDAQTGSAQEPNWDKEADVVIIGTGFAGLSAAITAKDAGAKVLILEKMTKEHEGGNSRVSGNMWWTPTNLPEGLEYMEALCAGLTDKECLQALAEEMLKLNGWLETLGVSPSPLGVFQPEHPELPGSGSVRTWSNGGGAGGGRLWIPARNSGGKLRSPEFDLPGAMPHERSPADPHRAGSSCRRIRDHLLHPARRCRYAGPHSGRTWLPCGAVSRRSDGYGKKEKPERFHP